MKPSRRRRSSGRRGSMTTTSGAERRARATASACRAALPTTRQRPPIGARASARLSRIAIVRVDDEDPERDPADGRGLGHAAECRSADTGRWQRRRSVDVARTGTSAYVIRPMTTPGSARLGGAAPRSIAVGRQDDLDRRARARAGLDLERRPDLLGPGPHPGEAEVAVRDARRVEALAVVARSAAGRPPVGRRSRASDLARRRVLDDVVERLLADPVEDLLELEREPVGEVARRRRSAGRSGPGAPRRGSAAPDSSPSCSMLPGRSSKISARISASASRWRSRSEASCWAVALPGRDRRGAPSSG